MTILDCAITDLAARLSSRGVSSMEMTDACLTQICLLYTSDAADE